MILEIDESRLPECLDVLHASYEPIAVQFGLTNENCPYRGRADLPLEVLADEYASGTKMVGYFQEKQMVGFLSLDIGDDEIKINDIVVLPEFRHRGTGTALLAFVREKACEYGVSKITLGMINDNLILKKWYERNGFVTTGYHQFPGAPFLVGYMEKYCK